WESVYKVPTLTEILFLILVGSAVFLGVRTGVIKIRKPASSAGGNGKIDPKDIIDPPQKQLPIENNLRNNHQKSFSKCEMRNEERKTRSIDGITLRENSKS
ncbi:MAG: hypothetical protein AAB785_02065, partial [Patescibacteria group bacterium]